MKKTFLRIVTVALILSLIGGVFAGCQKTPGETTTTKAPAADGDKTLLIGGIGPITGEAATYGNAVKNGAQLAINEINANGGVNGMTLKLQYEDDQHDAVKAVNAYNTLKDAKVKLLMGTVTSKPCEAVVEETKADNMFQLTASASSVKSIQYDNAFRICFNDPNQGKASAQYIAENNLATKIAVIYNNSDVYSTGIYETFVAELQAKNITPVTTQTFTDDSSKDFSVAIQKIQESGAELVFLPIYYEAAALILQQASKANLNAKFFGCDGLDGLIDQLGTDVALAEGVMLLTPFAADSQDAKSVAFVTAYKAAYNNETPNQFAADGYDAIYTIKAALEKPA
jgi:branched-chain amino acid transport system substrate-binding protein